MERLGEGGVKGAAGGLLGAEDAFCVTGECVLVDTVEDFEFL